MPRFVLLYHECPTTFGKPSHWDLMLEHNGALLTWSLAKLPEAWQPVSLAACADVPIELEGQRLPDHHLAYLDYEGPVSDNRGRVTRYDRGDYEVLEQAAGRLHVQLRGTLARGVVALPTAPAKSAPA